MTFGEQNTEKEAHDMLSYSFENGINILDKAEPAKVAARPHSPKTSYYELGFDQRRSTSNATSLDNPCSYYFLADEDQFKLDVSYIIGEVLKSEFKDRHLSGAGMGCQGHNICDEARENRASYACCCKNSECYNDRATDGLRDISAVALEVTKAIPTPKMEAKTLMSAVAWTKISVLKEVTA